jgi:hypothetical protein
MGELSLLKTLLQTECSCKVCQLMCTRPCWGTPEDTQKIIDAGYGDRLGLEYYTNDDSPETLMIQPAVKGYEGKRAPFNPISMEGCSFWKGGLCELHDLKLKPIGGKTAYHKSEYLYPDNNSIVHALTSEIVDTWKTEEGKALVDKWCKERNINPNEQPSTSEILAGGMDMLLHLLGNNRPSVD